VLLCTESELPAIVLRLTSGAQPPLGPHQNTTRRVLAFSGHCSWRAGQLEDELRRGAWGVCDGRLEDVVGAMNSHGGNSHSRGRADGEQMWREIWAGNRLAWVEEAEEEEERVFRGGEAGEEGAVGG